MNTVPKDPNGNPRLPLDGSGEFYRTQIELAPSVVAGDPIPLSEVPAPLRERAQAHLANKLRQAEDPRSADPEGWPAGAQISPFVLAQMAVQGDGSVKPAYFEFKVLLPAVAPAERGGPVKTDPEAGSSRDLGYILISATDDDFPVPEFATEGPTPCERLARLAGTSRINVIRYGPTFFAAEDEQGRLMATEGAMPFKLDPDVLALDGAEWRGDSDTGQDVSPRGLPDLGMQHYRSYLEFKEDFASNETYRKLREIKRMRAKIEWDIIRGQPPPTATIRVGETRRLLATLPATPAPEISFVTDSDATLLRISASTQGGVLLTGIRPGDGTLFVRQGSTEFRYLISVASAVGVRSAGDVLDWQAWYAGDWGMQPKYHQLKRDRWCDLVGCGPTAWAMLFAWFERNRGVEEAFRGEQAGLPPPDLSTQANRAKLIPIYDDLHEMCDVICNPASDEGGTYPPDMTDAFKSYTFIPASLGQIGRSWHTNAVTGTWPDAGAVRSRDAIKNGYPAVTGLGWMWHYVLAYGYGYEKIDSGVPGYTYTIRHLKCNMGWNGVGPRWYHMSDTFYAANCRLWSGPNAP